MDRKKQRTIYLWSVPRTLSTAFLRAMATPDGCLVSRYIHSLTAPASPHEKNFCGFQVDFDKCWCIVCSCPNGKSGSCPLSDSLPAATKLGQGNIFTSVCQEFCPQGGRVSASATCWDTPPRPGRHPPGADTPQTRQTPPWSRHIPLDQADTPRTRQTPPGKQTQAYGLQAAGTHPPGMHSCWI